MKTFILRTGLFVFLFFALSTAKAQWVTIPDPAFANMLSQFYYDGVQGNELDTTAAEILNETDLYINGWGVRDFTGIQYFKGLHYLEIIQNPVTTLSHTVLPPNILQLEIFLNDSLIDLPAIPSGVTYLSCYGNALTSLPALPAHLNGLDCGFNSLTSLPSLPSSLTGIDCSYNKLTSLPALPAGFDLLLCPHNQLSSLPELPDSLWWLDISDNPITCLPLLKQIHQFYFTNTLINCLPNYSSIDTSSPNVNTLPLCDVFNPNNCSATWNVRGKVYFDKDADCLQDSAENGLINIPVKLWNGNSLIDEMRTVDLGSYAFATDSFSTYTVTIDTTNLPFHIGCPANGIQTANVTYLDSLQDKKDFAIVCNSGFDLAAWSIAGRFRPGNTRLVNIGVGDLSNFYSAHCAAGVSGIVTVTITGNAQYVSPASGSLAPSSANGHVITWNVADFGNINFNSFNIMVQTDNTAVIGSQICFTVSVTPMIGDKNPDNNSLKQCFPVVGSFDPNEKEVYPAGNIDTATHWLTYTIHFQNTGTAEAQHIYVTDTLDSNIDAASFQLLAYSHQPMVQLKGNNLRFNFPNINLPDSNTNEALSHGYVQYKVKLKDNLPVGTKINNTAFIYFDFNAPVVTNTTSNTVALATSLADFGFGILDFGLNPNPASESVGISIDESMVGSNLTITDIMGRQVTAVQIRNPQFDIRNLSQGVYFVTVETKTGRVTKKLVKQ